EGEAAAAPLRVGADRADLAPTVRAHPLAGHRGEAVADADAVVAAEVDGAREERARLRPLDQIERLGDIGLPERDEPGVGTELGSRRALRALEHVLVAVVAGDGLPPL